MNRTVIASGSLLVVVFVLGLATALTAVRTRCSLLFFAMLFASCSALIALALLLKGRPRISIIFIVLSIPSFGLVLVGPILSLIALLLVLVNELHKPSAQPPIAQPPIPISSALSVKCPYCGRVMTVNARRRPFGVVCEGCGKRCVLG